MNKKQFLAKLKRRHLRALLTKEINYDTYVDCLAGSKHIAGRGIWNGGPFGAGSWSGPLRETPGAKFRREHDEAIDSLLGIDPTPNPINRWQSYMKSMNYVAAYSGRQIGKSALQDKIKKLVKEGIYEEAFNNLYKGVFK